MNSQYDIFIIGGGINGCGIARDAAGRGLRTGLAEAGDLAHGTSSASTKLIHGGLRYLEQYEFRLVREALKEREVLLRIAPHIVRPLRFILPRSPGMRPGWLLRLGLFFYDHLAGSISLPGSNAIDLMKGPYSSVLQPQFAKGFEYSDCRVDDSRLVILNARDAAARGAHIMTRTRVTSATRNGRTWDIRALDSQGRAHQFSAGILVNAAGPWADIVGKNIEQSSHPARIRLVQGAHIVVPKLYNHDHAYLFQNRDGRIVFAIPYERDFTLIGTTDREFTGDPAEARISEEETGYLIEAINQYFSIKTSRASVIWSFAGVRALADTGRNQAQAASRDYRLELDARDGGAPLLSVLGGKITSYRTLATQALKSLAAAMPMEKRLGLPEWTRQAPLPGGDLPPEDLAALGTALSKREGSPDSTVLQRWLASYGSLTRDLFEVFAGEDGPGQHFGNGLSAAEVLWLMKNEWAQTAEDLLWRRSKLGLRFSPAQTTALAGFMTEQAARN